MLNKTLLLLMILIFVGCSKSTKNKVNKTVKSLNASLTELEELNKEDNEFGERQAFDSLHFSIIRRNFKNGKLQLEVITDRKSKIDAWKEFYMNGQKKEEGQMTTTYHKYIGRWNYFSENGVLDSTVNYDEKLNIPYFKAIIIAKENGFEMPNIEINTKYEANKMYWEVSKSNEIIGSVTTAETILIDSETGNVIKPNYHKIRIY